MEDRNFYLAAELEPKLRRIRTLTAIASEIVSRALGCEPAAGELLEILDVIEESATPQTGGA